MASGALERERNRASSAGNGRILTGIEKIASQDLTFDKGGRIVEGMDELHDAWNDPGEVEAITEYARGRAAERKALASLLRERAAREGTHASGIYAASITRSIAYELDPPPRCPMFFRGAQCDLPADPPHTIHESRWSQDGPVSR